MTQVHEHPAVTTDVVLFALGDGGLSVLLIQRGKPPFEGTWAFPGGFVNVGESLQEAASRELEEETGIREVQLRQLRSFGDPKRDPRGHVVTVAYVAVVASNALPRAEGGSDASRAQWWPIGNLPPLAFDHGKILTYGLQRLHSELACSSADHGWGHGVSEDLSFGDLRDACRAIAERLAEET